MQDYRCEDNAKVMLEIKPLGPPRLVLAVSGTKPNRSVVRANYQPPARRNGHAGW